MSVLAREWYTRLKPLSVDPFTQLAKEFELYFLKNVCSKLSVIMLLRLRKGEEETLFDFVARFTNKIRGIQEASITRDSSLHNKG